MQISTRTQSDVSIVKVEGKIDTLTAATLTATLTQEIEQGRVRLIVDLSGVDYVSSAAVHALTVALRETRKRSGDVRLAGAQKEVRKIFSISGITIIAELYPTVDLAIASFSRKES